MSCVARYMHSRGASSLQVFGTSLLRGRHQGLEQIAVYLRRRDPCQLQQFGTHGVYLRITRLQIQDGEADRGNHKRAHARQQRIAQRMYFPAASFRLSDGHRRRLA